MQVVRLFSHVGVDLNESLAPCRIPLSQRATGNHPPEPGDDSCFRYVPGRSRLRKATNRASGSAAIAAAADDRNRVSGASPPRVRQLVNARARRVVAGVAGVEGLGVRRLRPRRLSDPPGKSGSAGMPVPTRTQNSTPATARDPLFARSGLVVEACRRPAPPPCVRVARKRYGGRRRVCTRWSKGRTRVGGCGWNAASTGRQMESRWSASCWTANHVFARSAVTSSWRGAQRRWFVCAAKFGVVAAAPGVRLETFAGWWLERYERIHSGERRVRRSRSRPIT